MTNSTNNIEWLDRFHSVQPPVNNNLDFQLSKN